MKVPNRITGPWTLADAYMPKDAGTVFTCFACAGGSTMGYKLAGFDVIGCNEIDPKVFSVYKRNHNPSMAYVCSIRDMLQADLPEALYNLDILDGSPPCTSFSTAGTRERDWGKSKQFAEGQKDQRLDDLFFEFIALASKLQPKFVIAENVNGMLLGKARGYIKEIKQAYDQAGYRVQLFKLNAARMGVPQSRGRVFFVAHRKDLELKPIKLRFNEKPITFGEVSDWLGEHSFRGESLKMTKEQGELWARCEPGKSLSTVHPKGNYFTSTRLSNSKPAPTLVAASGSSAFHPSEQLHISLDETACCSTFPMDMQWCTGLAHAKWLMGMSVPPFMMQRIALEVRQQWMQH